MKEKLHTKQMTPEDIEKHKDYFDNYELKPCPFCGRDMKYNEIKWTFGLEVRIDHDYDTRTLYTPCPMRFYKSIPWKDRYSGEVFSEDLIRRMKQQFIESWNRGATGSKSLRDTMKSYREKCGEPVVDDRTVE